MSRTPTDSHPPSPTPGTPPPEAARALSRWLREVGYGAPGLEGAVGASRAPLPGSPRAWALLAATGGPGSLPLLARLFLLAHPVEEERAREALPEWVLETFLGCGFLTAEAPLLLPRILLEPLAREGGLVASDPYRHLSSPGGFHHVLGSNATARHLLDFTPRRPVARALDLGTGCGIQALSLARHAGVVVATDLNPRAAAFVTLNAALNEASRIEARTGDLWSAVAGERFDLVVCNPPFVLAPEPEFLYRDSGLALDGIVKAVIEGAPRHLQPGGFLHLVAEWVECEDEGWEDRLGGWISGAGLDAVVFRTHALSPERYARDRLLERHAAGSPPKEDGWTKWRNHLREQGVRQVVGGLLALRLRGAGAPGGPARLRFEPLPGGPFEGAGEAAQQAFRAEDILAARPGMALLEARLCTAPDLELQVDHRLQGGGWAPVALRLSCSPTAGGALELPPELARFVAGFEGGREVSEGVLELARSVGVSPEEGASRGEAEASSAPRAHGSDGMPSPVAPPDPCRGLPGAFLSDTLEVVRTLVRRGFLRPEDR